MPQTPAPTRANVRQSATWRISDTNLGPPCQLTTHAADSMLFLSKSRLFGFLPTKFPEYPNAVGHLRVAESDDVAPLLVGPGLLIDSSLPSQLRHQVVGNIVAKLTDNTELGRGWKFLVFHLPAVWQVR